MTRICNKNTSKEKHRLALIIMVLAVSVFSSVYMCMGENDLTSMHMYPFCSGYVNYNSFTLFLLLLCMSFCMIIMSFSKEVI